ncbi:putative bifunctional diguanylate cyclase/phosphodiesterase [Kineococcus sp. SYSU DK006]|uniref:putative bifunctional diguanylate cyclase/phosphodiesterase n=1 Tax=Kineococcus sp. SYSU DK006 TaxID=3383127 RepID=UPI003D7E2697
MSIVSTGQRRLLAAAAGAWALYLLVDVAAFAVGHRRTVQLADLVLGTAAAALVVALLWVRAAGPTRERGAWRLFALAWSACCVSELGFDVAQLARGSTVPPGTGLEAGYLVCYVVLFRAVGKLLWPQRAGGGLGHLAESLGLALLAGALVQQFVARPLAATSAQPFAGVSFWVLVAAADVVIAACAAYVAFGARGDPRWWYLAAGMVVVSAGHVAFCIVFLRDVHRPGDGLDLLWTGGLLLVGVAATRPARPVPLRPLSQRSIMAAPALVLPTSVLVLAAGSWWLRLGPEVVLACVAATAAALVRWASAQRELLDLAQYRHEALTDELTGVPNRRALLLELERRIARRRPFTLAVVDLDRFKAVNDGLGHAAGDELLRQVVRRLTTALPGGSLLARLGGDELAAVLPGPDVDLARRGVERAHAALAGSYDLDGHRVHVGASVGLAAFPEHSRTAADLLRLADGAMYAAKAEGGTVRLVTGTTAQHAADSTRAAGDLLRVAQLRTALGMDAGASAADRAAAGRLVLHYQPQVDLRDDAVVGVEALVRWSHPQLGLIAPDDFLPLVERYALVHRLTRWALDAALRTSAAWASDGHDLRVAVNLSASSLRDEELPATVAAALLRHGRPADRLQLEVTESVAMADQHGPGAVLPALGELGVSLSIDDFGTGYSSLAYLREHVFDELKLDRSFVEGIGRDARAEAIATSTVWLAHRLGLRVVAEGIETPAAREHLAALGCDLGQGHLLGRPVPAGELARWLRRRTARVPAARPQAPAVVDLRPGARPAAPAARPAPPREG